MREGRPRGINTFYEISLIHIYICEKKKKWYFAFAYQ